VAKQTINGKSLSTTNLKGGVVSGNKVQQAKSQIHKGSQ
jgi:hypothetical protein